MIRLDQWKTSTASDILGTLVKTRSLDFNADGYLTLARKPNAMFTEHGGLSATGDVDFQDLVAITSDGTYYYFITPDLAFGLTASETALTWGEVSTGSAPTVRTVDDAVYYNGGIAVTSASALSYLTGFTGANGSGTWNAASDFSFASNPHPMCKAEHRNTLVIGDGNKVYQTDAAAWTDDDTNILTLPAEYTVTSIRWRGNKLYIGTRTLNGTNAMLFVWSGSGTSAESGWQVDADWIYSVVEYGSSVACLTSAGQLLRFNGGGFSSLANLPVYYTPHSWTENAGANVTGKATNRGIWSLGETIYFLIQGEPRGLFSPDAFKQPGGLWCYDPQVGLYHKSGLVTEPYRVLAISTLASSIFTLASAHGLSTGDPVWASSVGNVAALTSGFVYYAIVVSSTAIKLAQSPKDAYDGEFLVCTGTISADTLGVETLDAVANTTSIIPGPVHGLAYKQPSPFFASEILFGGSAQDPTNNTICAANSLGMGRNVGYFITPKIYGAGLEDAFNKITTHIKGLNLDTDKVVIKYRTRERFGCPMTTLYGGAGLASWVNDTSFTIATTLKDVRSAQVGDEVEIVKGAGAGYSAHITAVNDNTSTYTFTIDEAIPLIALSDVSDIYVDNWTKLAVITNASKDIHKGYHTQPIEGSHAWIQFKIELRGRDVSINVIELMNAISTKK